VLEVVRYAAERGACVSVDTTSPEVAAACLDVGACAVNDVSCLRDVELAKVVAANGAALILMHSRGTQEEMRGFSEYPDDAYGDVVADVKREWLEAAGRAMAAGVPKEALVMDPGFGFAKNARHSLELLRRLHEITGGKRIVLVGASRKSFLTRVVDPEASPDQRLGASVGAVFHALFNDASIVRVHDVRVTAQALDILALLSKEP
jgi:dihydropteroate synthase